MFTRWLRLPPRDMLVVRGRYDRPWRRRTWLGTTPPWASIDSSRWARIHAYIVTLDLGSAVGSSQPAGHAPRGTPALVRANWAGGSMTVFGSWCNPFHEVYGVYPDCIPILSLCQHTLLLGYIQNNALEARRVRQGRCLVVLRLIGIICLIVSTLY